MKKRKSMQSIEVTIIITEVISKTIVVEDLEANQEEVINHNKAHNKHKLSNPLQGEASSLKEEEEADQPEEE